MPEDWTRSLHQNVPFFLGLTPKQVKRFLEICKSDTYPPGKVLCEHGTQSNRLFVLVSGQLEILAADGTSLAAVRPVTTVGEMGFITRKPRSATVRAREESRVLAVEYHTFKALMDSDLVLQARIYHNMVRLLSERVSDANDLIVRYRNLYEAQQLPAVEATQERKAVPPGPTENKTTPGTEDPSEEEIVRGFYQMIDQEPEPRQLAEDIALCRSLRQDGYTAEDVAYAVKWTLRHIPAARRFTLVKLSIREAFEDKWSV